MDAEFPVRAMSEISSLGPGMKWQFFERLVAFIFEQNDFRVSSGVVKMFEGTKRQYDVIAESPRYTFAVDCKRWTGKRCRASLLRSAAEKHIERCMLLGAGPGKSTIPVIVTLMNESMVIHEGVPVVPVEMLNSFLQTWEDAGEIMRI